MKKYILCAAFVTCNSYAGEDIIGEMLDTYARQPIVVIVQPNNQLFPVIQPPLITRGTTNWGNTDFMLPEARQADKFDLFNER
jgi:hypothetical protein